MTKAILFSADNIRKAKISVTSLMQDFLKIEPGNTMIMPETKKGGSLVEEAIAKLQATGYTQEESLYLLNELVETLHSGNTVEPENTAPKPASAKPPRDNNF